ncbi:MAG: RNA-binding S4 domain-containing protein [Chlorobi bacterium]|nr:RNA-binding S4 domain-containing protein [Chlorobiota bacterium]
MRIDKFLWAVRIFKTRSQATDACRKGAVETGDQKVKPARPVHAGEIFRIRKNQIYYQIRVIRLTGKRLPAKSVPDFAEDITPAEELEKLKLRHTMYTGSRLRFSGRPTKKERRMLDRFFDNDENLPTE